MQGMQTEGCGDECQTPVLGHLEVAFVLSTDSESENSRVGLVSRCYCFRAITKGRTDVNLG